jgi:hypothetical protein
MYTLHFNELELVDYIPRVPWCIASATDSRSYPGEIEHVQDDMALFKHAQ